MPKLLNKAKQEFCLDIKMYHFGLAPDPYKKERWDTEEISILEMKQELAKARAKNIINKYNIDTLNQAIIDLKKEFKKLKKLK